MKFKSKIFMKALEAFKYNVPDNAEIEIIPRIEDIAQGQLCDAFVMVATWIAKPESYDSNKNDYTVTHTLECFPESEGRPPRFTKTSSRDIS